VVTGHQADELAPVLAGLPIRSVHNAGYDSGMFSSVRTGAAALGDDVEAFFVLPADYPLIRAAVLRRLIDTYRESHPGVIHPTCCGRRGHPPLLSARYRTGLLDAGNDDNLRSFLERQVASEDQTDAKAQLEVEVEDLTILMDMDTQEDYRRMERFAALLDRAALPEAGESRPAAPVPAPASTEAPSPAPPPALSSEDAFYLLSLLGTPARIIAHCRAVATAAETLARALKPHLPRLDIDLARAAGLLHDIARKCPKHAAKGQRILDNLGLARLGEVVGAHMVLTAEQAEAPDPTEEQLVYLADKLVVDDRLATLEERVERTLRKWDGDFPSCGDSPSGGGSLSRDGSAPRGNPSPSPEALEAMQRRMRTGRLIIAKVETVLGRPLEEVLPREARPSI
jgi:putative nucleotidyltransferase with HDIG domain